MLSFATSLLRNAPTLRTTLKGNIPHSHSVISGDGGEVPAMYTRSRKSRSNTVPGKWDGMGKKRVEENIHHHHVVAYHQASCMELAIHVSVTSL